MRHVIEPVDPALIVEANNVVAKDRGKGGDPMVTLVMNFGDSHDAEELLALTYRLQALAKLIVAGHGPAWVINAKGKKYKLVNEAMFRAAARAPLWIADDQLVGDLSFDPDEFVRLALEESDTHGSG
jgi:hypothetical protein